MMLSVLKAIQLAIMSHHGQMRKYHENVPYIIHPVRVMGRIEEYLLTSSRAHWMRPIRERVLIVAALHDVVEDFKGKNLTAKESMQVAKDRIQIDFGKEVVEDVLWLTNESKKHPELLRKDRKMMDREHIAKAPPHCKVIKLFDRWDNIEDMITEMPQPGKRVAGASPGWLLETYIPETYDLIEVIRGVDEEVAKGVLIATDTLKNNAAKQLVQGEE